MSGERVFLGFDFGTESVRVAAVDARGRVRGQSVEPYRHGQIVPGSPAAAALFDAALPDACALQHPADWMDSAAAACRGAMDRAAVGPDMVGGVGVDFTSCTMLPCFRDGTPLCTASSLRSDPHAWPKLWKHHGALDQAERINRRARERHEPWLTRYGGIVGLEWLFPKLLEVIERSPAAADAADVWLEAGDWFVWQLVGAPCRGGHVEATRLPRSTCQAGYKGLWSHEHGFPSAEFLTGLHPALADAARLKLPGRFIAPGQAAGGLCDSSAAALGLKAGTPVSAATIDAHAGVPGSGVGGPGTLVMVMGTSGCHMLMAREERFVPGVAGVVKNGILPGLYGYETGQAAMGDGFDLVRRLSGRTFEELDQAAARVPPGARGVMAMDWYNGCRTPLMDGSLRGAVVGLTLDSEPEHVYRAALEASAFGLRWIADALREGGLPVERFVVTGGLGHRNPLFVRIVAAALEAPVAVHAAEHGPALGAAILGALAAGSTGGGYDEAASAVEAMAGVGSALPPPRVVDPDPAWARAYSRLYPVYRQLAADMARPDSPMRRLAE
jgi:L-ribulokinase